MPTNGCSNGFIPTARSRSMRIPRGATRAIAPVRQSVHVHAARSAGVRIVNKCVVVQARRSFGLRLAVAAVMAALFLLALGYWWLDNLPHELLGTAMFVLLGWHVHTNRNWFRNLTKGRYGARRTLIVAFHLALILNMLIVLVTSLFVSKSIFVALGLPNSPLVSEIHWFSAYWVISLNSNQGGIPRIARPACCNPA